MSVPPSSQRKSAFGAAPKGYVPGMGRGAAGFTTRSDIGNMASSENADGAGGSRAAEARAAKLAASQQQNASRFGQAPSGYVAGSGRGAGRGCPCASR